MTTVRRPNTVKSYHSSALPITAAVTARALSFLDAGAIACLRPACLMFGRECKERFMRFQAKKTSVAWYATDVFRRSAGEPVTGLQVPESGLAVGVGVGANCMNLAAADSS